MFKQVVDGKPNDQIRVEHIVLDEQGEILYKIIWPDDAGDNLVMDFVTDDVVGE